jgi:cytochrome P450
MTEQTLPPGPKGLPRVRNALQYRRDPLRFSRKVEQMYHTVATLYFYDTPVFIFFRPEHIHYFLVGNSRNFDRNIDPNMRELMGDTLLTLNGEPYRQVRRLVQPAFHKKRVESYAAMMVEGAHKAMAERWQPGARVDMCREMLALTLRVVTKALFDIEVTAPDISRAFSAIVENPSRWLPLNLPFTSYGRRKEALRKLNAYVYDVVAERRAEGRDRGDILSMLLRAHEDGGVVTDQQVHDQTLSLFGAGHETTAISLMWTFYLLSEYQAVRERLLNDLRTVLGGRDPTIEDLDKLPYLDWVFNEALRMYPPIWQQGRHAIEAFDLAGYHFPANSRVLFLEWVTHYLPDVWGDPEVFRPERWDPVNGQKVPPGAYFPFGGGPRQCIGNSFAYLEARLILATILQRYTPRLVPGQRVEPLPRMSLRPKYGMPMILEPASALALSPAAGMAPARQA